MDESTWDLLCAYRPHPRLFRHQGIFLLGSYHAPSRGIRIGGPRGLQIFLTDWGRSIGGYRSENTHYEWYNLSFHSLSLSRRDNHWRDVDLKFISLEDEIILLYLGREIVVTHQYEEVRSLFELEPLSNSVQNDIEIVIDDDITIIVWVEDVDALVYAIFDILELEAPEF